MYKMEGRVRFSECDPSGLLTIPGVVNYFQDCSSMQSETIGVGMEYLEQRKRAWILSSWKIVIERRPKITEEIEVSTWASGFKGFFGPRDFVLKTKSGEVLAYARSLWVYMNLETGRPIKPEVCDIEAYPVGKPLDMGSVDRKIKLPEEAATLDRFSVRHFYIDTNNHVNNAKYIQLALEAVPQMKNASIVRVEYKKAAVYGDTLIAKAVTEEGRTVVMLCDDEENLYAAVEFIGEEKE